MTTSPAPPEKGKSKSHEQQKTNISTINLQAVNSTATHDGEDILGLQDLDPALNRKMHLVNNVRTAWSLCILCTASLR